MKNEDYWNLFWLSGMPEAWLMSRPGWGAFNTADRTAGELPRVGDELPREAKELRQKKEQKIE